VRQFVGHFALAVDVEQLNQIPGIELTLLICASGNVDFSTKRLTFRVYFEGTPSSSAEFYVQVSLPDPSSGQFLDQIGLGTGTWTVYSSPLAKSSFSSTATTITIQAGSLGGAFSGTIWFEDFVIQ